MRNSGISLSFIQTLAVMYLVVWSISPFMEVDMIYRVLAVAAVGIWFVVLVFRQNPLVLESEQTKALFFWVAVIVVVFIETGKVSDVIKQIAYFMLVICFFISLYYQEYWHELTIIVPVVLVLFIIFNFKTGNVLLEDPTIARALVRNDEEMYGYLRQGIGGYSLIYPQVCIFPAFVQWTLQAFRKNKLYFFLGIGYLASYFFVVFNAGYSTAIFTTVLGLVIMFLYKGNSAVRAFLVAIIIFLGLMLSIIYIASFRNWMLNTFQHHAIQHKIEDLVATSSTGEAEGSFAARWIRYQVSLFQLIRFPIIGALWRDSGGGHSAVLDTFAKYGLWGGVLYCHMIFYVPNFYKTNSKQAKIRKTANACLISIMFVALLDSFTYAFMATILLVLPICLEMIKQWMGDNHENSLVG